MAADTAALLAALDESHQHLEHTIAGLTDEQAREPSLLPGWSRGHVLTHLARNADALINLTVWARTGVETPMYPSREIRNATIEAQSGRSADELVADVVESRARLDAALAEMPAEAWDARIRWGSGGWEATADSIPVLRRTEVEVHHVDLNLDHTIAHWPADFVQRLLAERVADLDEEHPATGFTLVGNDDEGTWVVGDGAQVINGPPPALLGWLIGRTHGTALHSDRPLPEIGPWR